MKEQLKKRLVGASVLAALAVIFVPMLIDDDRASLVAPVKLPPAPPLAKRAGEPFASEVIQAPVSPEPLPAPAAAAPEPPVPVQPPAAPTAPQPPVAQPAPQAAAPAGQPRAPLSAWVIQVGSFREPARADALVARLREAGIDTLAPAKVSIEGVTWYRVRVGPEVDRQRAEALLPKVNRIAGLKGRVIRYP